MQESTAPADVEKEVRRLKSSDPVERAMATCALRKAGRNAAVATSSLIAMLGDDTFINPIRCLEDDRYYSEKTSPGREAAKTLAAMGEPALEHLLRALRGGDWRARKNAAWALGEMRYDDSSTRTRAIRALGAAIEDEHREVQTGAIDSLGEIRDGDALKPLVAALKRPDSKVRERAALALGEIRDSAAVESLIGALDDESLPVRLEVIRALAEIRDARAVEPMIAALSDTREEVRASLGDALKEITDQDFGADATRWREWLGRDK
ncbi:MAG: HEAT repeat domain-containing protein [Pyrinomonadaceae bacterium]